MDQQHGSYYVPEYSIWPIIGTVGLFLFAFGSLNFDSIFGRIMIITGAIVLIYMLLGWFRDIVTESRAGLYDAQMDRTFRWGMFWFLVSELFFFSSLIGVLIYVRIAILPALAGQGPGGSLLTHYLIWPDFHAVWPLLKNPAPYLFAGARVAPYAWGLPALNTLILLTSGIFSAFALFNSKRGNQFAGAAGLLLAIILGIVFLFLQIHYYLVMINQYGLTINSGIYGSVFFMITGFHLLHVLVGLLILSVILMRSAAGHFYQRNHFGFEASVWFWTFISIIWLIIFLLLYAI